MKLKKKKKKKKCLRWLKSFKNLKKDNPDSRMSLFMFRDKKKKEKTLLKNKIIELDLKYPEKEIIQIKKQIWLIKKILKVQLIKQKQILR